MKTTRRGFLGWGAGASAAMIGLPSLLVSRKARAATRAFGEAKHVLVLFARGGFRSHCTFNAVGSERHNPFGTQSVQDGTEWRLGGACGREDIPTSLGLVPALAKVTRDIAVIATVDHMPGSPLPDVDHRTATNRIATGAPEGTVGLLSRVGRHLPLYANGFSERAFPPVEIGPTEFGMGDGDYAATRPLSVVGARASFTAQLPIGRGWKIEARDALDQRFRTRRSLAYDPRISNFLRSKEHAVTLSGLLGDPSLDLINRPEASAHGVTNGQLLEVLGDMDLAQLGDVPGTTSWGADVAMGLRFLGFGAPMCVVTRDFYDMHDNERMSYAPRTQDLVRQLAGLRYLLPRMSHPSGGTFWDHTLVAVVSEFSRNNTRSNGFNSGNGSDHVGDEAGPARNQAIAVMGGMVAKAGKKLGETDSEMNAVGPVWSSRSLLSTFLDVLGIDHNSFWPDAPIQELFT
jgi:uncharacterized protein (DUF1501 family)